jgi:hypothetical protein
VPIAEIIQYGIDDIKLNLEGCGMQTCPVYRYFPGISGYWIRQYPY